MRLSTPSTFYPDSHKVVAFHDELRRRVASLPGVEAVGTVRILPLATEADNPRRKFVPVAPDSPKCPQMTMLRVEGSIFFGAAGWPETVLDWDILFLLPLPWWGPVIAPVCALSM